MTQETITKKLEREMYKEAYELGYTEGLQPNKLISLAKELTDGDPYTSTYIDMVYSACGSGLYDLASNSIIPTNPDIYELYK